MRGEDREEAEALAKDFRAALRHDELIQELQPLLKRIRESREAAFYYRNLAIGMVCAVRNVLSGSAEALSMRDAIWRDARQYAKADALAMSAAEVKEQAACEKKVKELSDKLKGRLPK